MLKKPTHTEQSGKWNKCVISVTTQFIINYTAMTYMSKSSYLHFINEIDEDNVYGLTSLKELDGCIVYGLFELSPLYNELEDDNLSYLYQLHKTQRRQTKHTQHTMCWTPPYPRHKTKTNKIKYNTIFWTPLWANKHK
jgi:hypothetical protein